MFYKVVQRVVIKDEDKTKPTFFGEISEEEGAILYYRSVLQAQIAADNITDKSANGGGELKVDLDCVVRQMKKEDYVKYLITHNVKSISLVYMPRRARYSQLYGRASLYNLIMCWDEYLEEVYV